jgi:hypothetical protein
VRGNGCTEALVLARGFKIDQLAVLVGDGLATAQPGTMRAGGRQINVVWVQITETGRRAIVE